MLKNKSYFKKEEKEIRSMLFHPIRESAKVVSDCFVASYLAPMQARNVEFEFE